MFLYVVVADIIVKLFLQQQFPLLLIAYHISQPFAQISICMTNMEYMDNFNVEKNILLKMQEISQDDAGLTSASERIILFRGKYICCICHNNKLSHLFINFHSDIINGVPSWRFATKIFITFFLEGISRHGFPRHIFNSVEISKCCPCVCFSSSQNELLYQRFMFLLEDKQAQ